MPVTVLDLNQNLSIIKTGSDSKNWDAVTDMVEIIQLLTSYETAQRAEYRDELSYVSPSKYVDPEFSEEVLPLTGERNTNTYLSLPFSKKRESGVYAVEIRSDISSRKVSAYNLTLLTDLNIHMKKGQNDSTVWVTSYESGLPVANAEIAVYDCLSQAVLKGSTNNRWSF